MRCDAMRVEDGGRRLKACDFFLIELFQGLSEGGIRGR